MNRTRFIAVAAILGAVAIAALAAVALRNGESSTGNGSELPKLSVGIQSSPAMALVMVAEEEGFFDEEGVDVQIEEFTAGKFALQAFLGGSVDVAVPGDVPACLAALQGHDLAVVGQVVERTVNEVRMVALKDETATDPKTFFAAKKRRLATSFGGGPEMFTYSFLKHHGIAEDAVELVSQKPEDMPAALQSRSVDAIAIFDPFAFIAEDRLGDEAVTFTAPEVYSELYVIAVSPERVRKEPETVSAFLRGLKRAESFVEENPEESKKIVGKYTKLDERILNEIWGSFVFKVALTPELLRFWRAEAEWAEATGKVRPGTPTPDFRAMIDDSFLREIDADAVKLSGASVDAP